MRAGVLIAVVVALFGAQSASAAELAPDIDMFAPSNVQQTTDGSGRSFVAFDSYVENVGPGVLKLVGGRPDALTDKMDVTQVLLGTNSVSTGLVERAVPAGEMQFSPAGGHDHWHYLRFQDYMLLSVPSLDFVAPTRKTGFCLVGLAQSFSCGKTHPDYLQIGDPAEAVAGAGPFPATRAMGLIVKGGPDIGPDRTYLDHYSPTVEGQDIDITNVPDGRYCLSLVVNPAGRLVEADTSNNGASRLLDVGTGPAGRTVSFPQGQTYFEDSATCGLTRGTGTDPGAGAGAGTGTGTDTGADDPPPATAAQAPPPLTAFTAARLARSALAQKFRRPTGLSRRCRPTGVDRAACAVAFKQNGTRYAGTVSIKQKPVAGEWRWFYRVNVARTRGARCTVCPPRVRTQTLFGGVLLGDAKAARRVMRLPPGRAASSRPGVAWSESMLCPISRAQIAARKPVG